MANTFTLISSSTVGSGGAASISFISIVQTYTDLLLVHSLRESGGSATAQIIFNSSTSTYTNMYLRGNGAAASSGFPGTTFIETLDNFSGTTASTFGNTSLYIPNYTGSDYKSTSVDTVTENNATTAYVGLNTGLWSTGSAITRIDITLSSGTFNEYSSAYLYGIKNS